MKLGKSTEYKSHYDPSLIDVFPRTPRREGYTAPMFGVDVWTCYEFSFLLPSGRPYFTVLRIYNNADSPNIFESKSLKLYLNSYNNTFFANVRHAMESIKYDLSQRVESEIMVREIKSLDFDTLEKSMDESNLDMKTSKLVISDYEYNPSLLQVEPRGELIDKKHFSNLLRSNCEVTNQPDWGRVTIYYKAFKEIDQDSLLRYIISFRNHQGFHEIVCERIYNDLYELLVDPLYLAVLCQYTRRGGIDINPYRSNENHIYYSLFTKLLQQ